MLRSSTCRATVLWVGGVISSLGLGGPPTAQAESYNFVTIDLPGAVGTDIYGINNQGLISGLGFNSSFQSSGFLYYQGNLTT
jgi:hypothetical protein